jgi:exonuclease III
MTRLTSMIGDAWNIRGLNKSGRISCVADLISKYRLDFIGI